LSRVGSQVFISHSSRDQERTEGLKDVLESSGFDSLFLSFDPIDGIPPGANWERELYLALRRCDTVVALDSRPWRTSPWCFAELALARSLGKTVILLRAGDDDFVGEPPGASQLVADSQLLSVPDLERGSLGPLLRSLDALGIGALRSFRWDPTRPPYPGLVALEEDDAAVFFGRSSDTRGLIDLIERVAKYGDKQMVLVVGPSGSGKSSLLRAAVLPQMRLRPGWHVVGPFRADPMWPLTSSRRSRNRWAGSSRSDGCL
jgi:hypothetical protein